MALTQSIFTGHQNPHCLTKSRTSCHVRRISCHKPLGTLTLGPWRFLLWKKQKLLQNMEGYQLHTVYHWRNICCILDKVGDLVFDQSQLRRRVLPVVARRSLAPVMAATQEPGGGLQKDVLNRGEILLTWVIK